MLKGLRIKKIIVLLHFVVVLSRAWLELAGAIEPS